MKNTFDTLLTALTKDFVKDPVEFVLYISPLFAFMFFIYKTEYDPGFFDSTENDDVEDLDLGGCLRIVVFWIPLFFNIFWGFVYTCWSFLVFIWKFTGTSIALGGTTIVFRLGRTFVREGLMKIVGTFLVDIIGEKISLKMSKLIGLLFDVFFIIGIVTFGWLFLLGLDESIHFSTKYYLVFFIILCTFVNYDFFKNTTETLDDEGNEQND